MRLAQFGGTLPDLVVETGIECLELFVLIVRQYFEVLLFLFQLLPFQRMAHDQQDVVVLPWLGDVPMNFALIDGVENGLDISVTGQQQIAQLQGQASNIFKAEKNTAIASNKDITSDIDLTVGDVDFVGSTGGCP